MQGDTFNRAMVRSAVPRRWANSSCSSVTSAPEALLAPPWLACASASYKVLASPGLLLTAVTMIACSSAKLWRDTSKERTRLRTVPALRQPLKAKAHRGLGQEEAVRHYTLQSV